MEPKQKASLATEMKRLEVVRCLTTCRWKSLRSGMEPQQLQEPPSRCCEDCLLIALAIASSSHSPLPPHRTRHCLLIALAIASSSHSPLPPHRTRHCLLIALAIASSSHSPLPPHRTRHCLTFAESSGLTVGWYVYISQLLTRRRDASAYFTWERIIQHRC